jgi:hypothetical protein
VKIGRLSTISLALFVVSACGDSTGPQDSPLVLQILDTQTAPPAKVSVTFQVTT